MEERGDQDLTETEIALELVKRKRLEAEAEMADEKALIQIIGLAGFILVGLAVCLLGFLWKESVAIGSAGGVIAAIGVGLLTALQALKFMGRST